MTSSLIGGWAKQELAPQEPLYMAGYGFRTTRSKGVYMPLRAGAVYLRDTAQELLLLPMDLASVSSDVAAILRQQIQIRLGLKDEQVVLLPTHTHSGPLFTSTWVPPVQIGDPELRFRQQYFDAITACAAQARAAAAPIRLEVACGSSDLGVNRRGPKRRPNPQGMRDQTVTTLILTHDAPPSRSCVLFAYGCHPTVRSGYLLGPDFPGPARLYLEEKFDGLTAFFLQGFEGDVRPNNIDEKGDWLTHSCFLDPVMTFGRQMGQDVQCILSDAKRLPLTAPLRTSAQYVDLPLAPCIPEEAFAYAQAKGGFLAQWAQRAREQFNDQNPLPPTTPMAFHAATIGNHFGFLGLGGEICSGYAHAFRRRFPDRHLLLTALTDDNASYLPTDQILQEGGYETQGYMLNGPPGPFAPGIEPHVLDAGARLLDDLWNT